MRVFATALDTRSGQRTSGRSKNKLCKILECSREAINSLSDRLSFGGSITGLDDQKSANQLTERLLETDIRTAIQAMRDAHRSFYAQDSGDRPNRCAAADTLVALSQLIVPALYDYGVVRWAGSQRDDGSSALVPLPACTKTVAEIIMAGTDGRATRFRHRENEDDQPEGELSLPQTPECGIDAGNSEHRSALQQYLNKKFNPGECEIFRRAIDDYLVTTFPRRAKEGRTLEERITLTADLLESKRRDTGLTFYLLFDLPKDAEGQNAMRTMVKSLKRDYPALAFLCLDDSIEREREEMKLVDPLCRMLPVKDPR